MGVKDRSSPCRSSNVSNTKAPRSDGYFLECRKDAQCECSMCKASITATLDLLQPFRPSTKENQPWPPPFPSCFSSSPAPSLISKGSGRPLQYSPLSKTPLHRKNATFFFPLLLLLPSALLFAMPWVVSCFAQPRFHHEGFQALAQASFVRTRLLDRLDYVQRRISRVSRGVSVSNCTAYEDGSWRLAENEYLSHARCLMYASPLESVSMWGYAAKTGGVLGRSLVDRSFTVLSGRVMEWQEGHIQSIVHQEGSSWTMPRFAASAIALDSNTWILEYRRTPLSAGIGDMHGAMHLVSRGLARVINYLKLYTDTAFFVHKQGLNLATYQALSSTRLPPT